LLNFIGQVLKKSLCLFVEVTREGISPDINPFFKTSLYMFCLE
jgi:hypothetical protein